MLYALDRSDDKRSSSHSYVVLFKTTLDKGTFIERSHTFLTTSIYIFLRFGSQLFRFDEPYVDEIREWRT